MTGTRTSAESAGVPVDRADHATFEYRLPSLGADMDDGTIVEWRVEVGDEVARGDIAAVVETDKSDIDIEIWHGGIVEELLAEVGERVDVGTPIARLRSTGAEPVPIESLQARAFGPPQAQAAPVALPPPAGAPPPVARPSGERVPASPRARRLAAERGIDLADIVGSGPAGAVVHADVVAAAHPPQATAATRTPQRMRALIADRMERANREIPHYHLARDVDLGAMSARLDELNAQRPITERLLPAAMFIRAVALAAARHRSFNGFWTDGRFEAVDEINVAMAISLRAGGLVTPHIANADRASLDETMAALTELVAAARRGTLRSSWMTGATITITNLGDTGADLVHGVISPPQVALVGFGQVRQRPWVVDDAVVVRPIATITLAADHRATDGALGSRFLAAIASHLENPEKL